MERKHEKYENLIARCKALSAVPTAVAHPCDESDYQCLHDQHHRNACKPGLGQPWVPQGQVESGRRRGPQHSGGADRSGQLGRDRSDDAPGERARTSRSTAPAAGGRPQRGQDGHSDAPESQVGCTRTQR